MIGLEARQNLARNIHAAQQAGARLKLACATAGIDVRTLQRWKARDGLMAGDGRPAAQRPVPAHALSPAERAEVLRVANEVRFADVPPARIVPMLADEGVYLASESTFARILREHGQNAHRGRAKAPATARPPTTHIATAPRQVWCWDMTYLPAAVAGRWFYLYLILDLYSRKIVGWEVHETDAAEHAAHLVRRTALAEDIAARDAKPVLHGDNGATLKATTGLAMLPLAGRQTLVLAAPRERRQRLRRVAVPHRQVPARVPCQGLRRSRRGQGLGSQVRGLVQRRASSQRHPLRQPGAAPCGTRQGHPGGPSCPVPPGQRAQPGALVWLHERLVAHRRGGTQPGARRRRHPRCQHRTYSAAGCLTQATTTLTRADGNGAS